MSGQSEHVRTHHARRIIMGVVLALLVLLIGVGAWYAGLINHTITTNIKHEVLLPTPSAEEPASPPTPAAPAASRALNILLIGSDAKQGKTANGRSDVIILAHVSKDHKKVYLVHFPRDMYVEIPGWGENKINAAYAYGGPQLLVKTLRKLVDVPIDHMAVIGFQGFQAMTDAIGGVDVYAEEASVDEVYNDDQTERWYETIHVGMNHLNGNSALAFVRERYQLSKGDISRGRRQQAFVKALILKVLSRETLMNPVRFTKLVDAATRYLTLDAAFSVSEVYSLALSMRTLRSQDIIFITAPISGFGRSPQGASIDIVNTAKMAQLSTALKTDDMSGISFGEQIP